MAVEFTGDAERYGRHMLRVVREWRFSCEHNLSHQEHNRRAWVGHAACALALGCPEDITREAWGYLSKAQHDAANNAADRAIREWEAAQGQHIGQMELFDA